MQVIESLTGCQNLMAALRVQSKRIALVPTMGYLHAGHLSLIQAAKNKADFVVVSIFVNPLQFAQNEDLSSYPRDLAGDFKKVEQTGADALFLPDLASFYPPQFQTFVEVTQLSQGLCAKTRPTHFRGVTTVVMKLLHIVQPHDLWLGEKDFQQVRVLEQMVADLAIPVAVCRGATLRDTDGLALSSRNVYLSPNEREHALVLFKILEKIKESVKLGERCVSLLIAQGQALLATVADARLDYLVIVNEGSLLEESQVGPFSRALIAVFIGRTRLIDNMRLM